MQTTHDIKDHPLADAWADVQARVGGTDPLSANAYRLAFADPEFLLRRETRGIRFQLEMLKPDLEQQRLGIEHTIVVFGSARFSAMSDAQQVLAHAERSGDPTSIARAQAKVRNAHYYEQAQRFGQLVAEHSANRSSAESLYICTGGGPGIMEAANRGAHDRQAMTVGLSIALPHEEAANRYVTPELNFKFHYFALRKMHFMMRAKALIAFPGGFGTLDELFEVITLVQTKKSKPVPIILFGSNYWKRLLNFELLVEEGTISSSDLELIHYVDQAEVAWERIRAFYQL
ncbi:MAG: TIGR00730 family Rossman fold protein [Burkholderiaceae bacterium]